MTIITKAIQGLTDVVGLVSALDGKQDESVVVSGTTLVTYGALSKTVTYTGTLPTDPFVEADRVASTSNAPALLYKVSALP